MDIKVSSYSHRVFESIRLQNGFNSEQIEKSLDLERNILQIKKAKESLETLPDHEIKSMLLDLADYVVARVV